MTSTVNLDPPTLHAEIEAGRQRAERRNPACPRCGRRNAVKGYRPGARKATFYCDPDRSIGGCGTEFEAT